MARGSIKHDQSKKGIVPGAADLQKNRKSLKRKKIRDLTVKQPVNAEQVVQQLKNEGQLVPVGCGKLIKVVDRPRSTPPPHQRFRTIKRKKLTQTQMSIKMRAHTAKKNEAKQ
eukprot:TRINITY_DN5224_c0_g2_i5.p1 TRINITY_DN5224_c0_g2~~TRINITY_DN5224_c0_g2_i5.p1  ORF type:complete len:113 (+),score=14.59 TRINITY_DN5224_c0_g2_i5:45-383(+)